jgi:hypothetical protein
MHDEFRITPDEICRVIADIELQLGLKPDAA